VPSLSTLSVPVIPYRLLGTPDDLELRKRKGMNGLNVNHTDLAGLTYDAISHGTPHASCV